MKKLLLLLLLSLNISFGYSQIVEYPSDNQGNIGFINKPIELITNQSKSITTNTVDTLVYNGNNAINIAILGDGFLLSEKDTMKYYCNKIIDKFNSTIPFSKYPKSFNFYMINVESTESGIKHPVTAVDCNSTNPQVPFSNPITPLGCTFDYGNIHRLVYAVNQSTINQIVGTTYDYTLILANSNFYGGSGGTYPVATKHPQSADIMIHEFAHKFGNLADEYSVGATCGLDKPNVTDVIDPLKWDSIVPTYFQGANYCNTWYRPELNCKMRNLSYEFCSVCEVVLENKIKSLTLTTPRQVLSEYICNTSCFPCSLFTPTMRALMLANSSEISYTERHTNIPSSDPYYNQGWPYGTWYKAFNQIGGNPCFFWDGKFHFTNDANQACFDSIQAKPSYLEISSTYHLSSDKDSIYVTTILNPLADISGDLYLHTNIKFGDSAHFNAYMFSGKLGEVSISDLVANQSDSFTIGQLIPTAWSSTIYNKDSLKVITYVQSHINSNPIVNDPPTHEVFNSTYAVKEPQSFLPLSVTNQTGNVICPQSGWISQTTSGGNLPYSYIWSNGATDEDIADLVAGTYSCTTTSMDGQVLVTSYTLINVAIATPTNVTFSNIQQTKFKINCFSVPYANKYQFQYRKTGTTTWSSREVNYPYVTLSNLVANTSYDVRVRARCKTLTLYKNGLWTPVYVVNTAMRLEEAYQSNPVIYIYDIMGREVYRGFEVPKLPDGTYIKLQDTIISKLIIIN